MVELSDPDKMMFQLDLYWIDKGGKDALKYFDKYPGRFMLWHIKDKMELGESGTMNFTEIFKHKKESGLKYGIIEVEEYNFAPLVSVQKSLEYLKTTKYQYSMINNKKPQLKLGLFLLDNNNNHHALFLNSAGDIPVNFLNDLQKVDFELNPDSSPIETIL